MPAPDPIPPEQLACLWALLNDPPACRRLIGPPWRPRRLRLPCRVGVVRARR